MAYDLRWFEPLVIIRWPTRLIGSYPTESNNKKALIPDLTRIHGFFVYGRNGIGSERLEAKIEGLFSNEL
jgi:hypothetical protein